MLEAQPRGTRSGTQRIQLGVHFGNHSQRGNGRLASRALKIASPRPQPTTPKPTRAGWHASPNKATFGGNLAALPGVCGVTTDPSIPGPSAASSPTSSGFEVPRLRDGGPGHRAVPRAGPIRRGLQKRGARGAPQVPATSGDRGEGTGHAPLHSARPRERREVSAGRHLRSPGSRRGRRLQTAPRPPARSRPGRATGRSARRLTCGHPSRGQGQEAG